MMDISEKNFEAQIEHILRNTHGYQKRESSDYDAGLCLIPNDVMDFILATQPDVWDKLKKVYGDNARAKFLTRLAEQIEKRGTLDVLRNGIKDAGVRVQLVYFRPSSGLNEVTQRQYQANLFSIVRQLHYRADRKSLDLGLFVNGLPIFTAELKNPFTGQNVHHARRQYSVDRDPRDPLLQFGRCLIHFAVDPDQVYMTPHLRGEKTFFLPFNRGRNGGAGNRPIPGNFATVYLWEEVWAKDSVLNLLDQFIHTVELEDENGQPTGERRLIIPRYHQLDAVRRLIADVQSNGVGGRYLIQHSAGSGKSYSIAWLAHQLASLHNTQDQRVFDSIIVITDRRVLDRQLQSSVRQFEQVRGMVENIDQTSRQLRQALADGKQIIVTTLQKFPMIVGEMTALSGSRFAVIIDEAHSSQSGESVKSMKAVLRVADLDAAEAEEGEPEPRTYEDEIIESIQQRRQPPNVSMFAFTATPKAKTLELFGRKLPDGHFEPFSLYSMRQAIEEGFILDVLENYITYKTYWHLLKTVADDPMYESKKAQRVLRRFVDINRHTIEQKIAIIVQHFDEHVAGRIAGQAKTMIVTRSRLHAVRYVQALRQYLRDHDYPYEALVAFSGTVRDNDVDYTESSLNGFPDKQTAEQFKTGRYRFLVVANKFQTGFDQPLLYAMYVDKKLSGVHAVQTLSRLNRTRPDKDGTLVLDFANDADEIQKAFAPYYDRTILSEATDHNLLYDCETELRVFGLYTDDEVNRFAVVYFTPNATQNQLHAPLDPVVVRYLELSADLQHGFRSKLEDYIRLYAFLAQVIPFDDPDLEKLYAFAKFLRRKLPIEREELPLAIVQNIDLDSLRIHQINSGKITPESGDPILEPMSSTLRFGQNEEMLDPLSAILNDLNTRFGYDFTEADRVTLQFALGQLAESQAVQNSVRVNPPDKVRLTAYQVLEDIFQGVYTSNFDLYKQVTDNERFREALFGWLFEKASVNK
jgi:type I restriction enzyme R subunit